MKIVWVIFSLILIGCSQNELNQIENQPESETEFSVPIYNGPDFTPFWNQTNVDTFHTISPFDFVNQFGEQVNSQITENKTYVVNFFFTTCNGICPKMMKNMELLANHFESDTNVIFISHTVTPWIDDVFKLKEYSTLYNVKKDKWHLVTGNKTDIYQLARQSYFVEEEPGFTKDSSEFLHTEHFILIDKKKHIRGIYNGTLELEMERTIEDIEWLLNNEN